MGCEERALERASEREFDEFDEELAPESGVKLPRCANQEDRELVDSAVRHIRTTLEKTLTRGLEEIGEYLLETFYGDDLQLYQSIGRAGHVSLRALELRCESLDLPVSRTFLSNALRMAVAVRSLPETSRFLELPPSHRVELLKLKSQDRVELLAQRAIESRMSVRKLRSLVARDREKTKSTRGRRPTPPVLLALTHCVRELRDETTGRLAFHREDVSLLDEDQRQELARLHEVLARRVDELARLVR